jgi:hypothetical protein
MMNSRRLMSSSFHHSGRIQPANSVLGQLAAMKAKQPPGPPMTLGNMRARGVRV